MDVPVDAAATGWTADPIVGSETGCRPRRLIELDVVDLLPAVRRASPAEQEGQGDRPADLESLTRPDVDVPWPPADIRRVGGVALDGRRATKWSAGEGSVAKQFVGGVELDLTPATSAADFDLEAEGGYLAECCEGQRVEHPPTLDPRRRASLPAVLILAGQVPLPLVACSCFFGVSVLRE
jgi:hypothetical protein